MKKIIIGSLVALAAIGCTSSDKTTLKGTFADAEFPLYVHVSVPELLDTLVTLQSPEFLLEVPVCKTDFSSVAISADENEAAAERFGFISDGTVLNIERDGERYAVKSSSPKTSLQEAFNAFSELNRTMGREYRETMGAIADSTSLTDAQKDSLQEDTYEDYVEGLCDASKAVIENNSDNVLSLVALRGSYYEFEDSTLEVLLGGLDSTIAANPFVGKLSSAIEARKQTQEGRMFKDFTITQSDGKDASLSDYVGKGKYMLVDFWASWCGPCKREIPNVKAVYDKYHGADFDVLSVAVWEKNAQVSLDTAKAYGVTWNQIVDAKSVPTELYGIQGIPHIVLFGPDGTILKRGLYGEAIEEEVSKYVAK